MKRTLMYTKKLERVGLSRDQAEAHLEILEEVFEGEVATKTDVQMAVQEFKAEVAAVAQELRAEMRALDQKLTIKFGVMQAASVTLIVALIKLF